MVILHGEGASQLRACRTTVFKQRTRILSLVLLLEVHVWDQVNPRLIRGVEARVGDHRQRNQQSCRADHQAVAQPQWRSCGALGLGDHFDCVRPRVTQQGFRACRIEGRVTRFNRNKEAVVGRTREAFQVRERAEPPGQVVHDPHREEGRQRGKQDRHFEDDWNVCGE